MSAPFGITSATLDKTDYNVGDVMMLTVKGTFTVIATVSVAIGGVASPLVQAKVHDPLTVSDPDRTWAPVSNDGATAVYTSKA